MKSSFKTSATKNFAFKLCLSSSLGPTISEEISLISLIPNLMFLFQFLLKKFRFSYCILEVYLMEVVEELILSKKYEKIKKIKLQHGLWADIQGKVKDIFILFSELCLYLCSSNEKVCFLIIP